MINPNFEIQEQFGIIFAHLEPGFYGIKLVCR